MLASLMDRDERLPGSTSRRGGDPRRLSRWGALVLAGTLGFLHAGTTPVRPERIAWLDPVPGVRLAAASKVRPVRLQSGAFAGAGELAANLAAAAARNPRAETLHLLVQCAGVPGDADRTRLAQAGIRLLGYVPDGAWFATVRRDADLDAARDAGLRWLGGVYPEDKLSPSLAAGTPGPWTVEPDGRWRLRLRAFEDVAAEVLMAAVTGAGGELRASSVGGGPLEVRVAPADVPRLVALDEVRWLEAVPPPPTTFNDGLRTNLQVQGLEAPPYELTGAGVVVAMWDAGWVDFDHPDFAGRVFPGETNVAELRHFHSTHVAGTLGGSGAASEANEGLAAQWRGVAPGATIISYDFSTGSSIDEHVEAHTRHGAVISQNSWGITLSQFFGNCHLLGDYTGDAPDYDRLATGSAGAPYHVIFAAGNARGRRDANGCPSNDYETIGVPATAKNILTVGAVNSDDHSMTAFSGWGPTDDGRVKPELVAAGDELAGDGGIKSTLPDGAYGLLVGTSMAAPAVSGAAALLIEQYRSLHHGQNPLPATVRGLLVHTAADLDDETDWFNPGPDFASGYGRVQARAAVDHLRAGGFLVGSVGAGAASHHALQVPAGTETLRLTLVWDDPPAQENVTQTLVNDLDLVLLDPQGNRHFPWTLDPALPAMPARRDRPDLVNVIEQIVVDGPVTPGTWAVTVQGTRVPAGPQKFALLYTPVGIPPTPLLALDSATPRDTGAGNGNGFVDPGEEINETVVLRHTDGPGATHVTAWLTTDSPWVQMIAPGADYPDLLPGTTVTNQSGFSYRVSKAAPCGEALVFQQVTAVGEVRFTNQFTRMVGRLEVTNIATQTFSAPGLPLALEDVATTVSVLPVSLPAAVLDVKVSLRLDHPWLDDLRVELRAPDETRVVLLPAQVYFGENLGRGDCDSGVEWMRFDDAAPSGPAAGTAPFTGVWKPHEALTNLNQRPLAGDWALAVIDTSEEDTGTLRCWELEIRFAQSGYLCDLYNHPPVVLEAGKETGFERPHEFHLGAMDPDGDPVTFRIVTPPAHGTLVDFDPATGTGIYQPAPGHAGPDEFTFLADDGYAASAPGGYRIEVRPPSADLALALELTPAVPRHDQPFTLSLTVTNRGPDAAVGARLTNQLPAGAVLRELVLSQGDGVVEGLEVVCELGTLPAGGGATVVLTLEAPEPRGYAYSAVAASEVVELLPEDNAVALDFVVPPVADLRLVRQPVADPAPLGAPLVTDLVVTNAGPHAATAVLVQLDLPPGTRFESGSTTQGSWTHEAGRAVATLGTLAAGEVAGLQVVLVPEAVGLLALTATVAGAEEDRFPGDNSGTAVTTVRGHADLQVAWQSAPSPVGLDHPFIHRLTLANLGPMTAQEAVVQIQLPAGAEVLSATASQSTAAAVPGGLEWAVGALDAAAVVELELSLRATSPGWVTNQATATALEFDANPANNAAVIETEVRPEADLMVTLTPPPDGLVLGRATHYVLSVTNRGPVAATAVRLTHPLSPLLIGRQILASQGTTEVSEGRLLAALGVLEPGAAAEIRIEFEPAEAGPFLAEADVEAFETDPEAADNHLEVALEVKAPADLSLAMTVAPNPVLVSHETVFALVAFNLGPYAATDVQVVNPLPEGLEFLRAEAAQGDVQVTPAGLVFAFGELPPRTSATGWVHVATLNPGSVTNLARVSASQPDFEPGNNEAWAAVRVDPAPDLVVAQRLAGSWIALDRTFTLQLAVTNRSTDPATQVRLTNSLPGAFELLSVAAPGATVTLFGRTLVADLGSLPPETGTEVELTLRATEVGAFTNELTAVSAEADRNPADNVSRQPLSVGLDADVAVRCEASPAPLAVGDSGWVRFTLTNQGPYSASTVGLRGLLPAGLVLTGQTLSQGEWHADANTWEARLGQVHAGGSAVVTLEFRAATSGTWIHAAVAQVEQPDLVPDNNACACSVLVQPTAQLTLALRAAPEPTALAEPFRLYLSLTNSGPEQATGVAVVGSLPAGLVFSNALPSQGGWDYEAPALRWHAGDLAAGSAATLEVVLTPTTLGPVTNAFLALADGVDLLPDDNRAEAVSTVRPAADLALRIEAPDAPLVRGSRVDWAFVVENRGPAPATALRFHQPLPDWLEVEAVESAAGDVLLAADSLDWQLAGLEPAATATLHLAVVPRASGTGTISASVAGFEIDLDPDSNEVRPAFEVIDQADLGLTQSVTLAEVFPGGESEFVLTVTNRGPHLAPAVVLSNALPSGLTLLEVSTSQGTVATNDLGLAFALGALEPAATASVTVRVRALDLGSWIHPAVVSAAIHDPHPEDNAADGLLTVLPGADLAVLQSVSEAPIYRDVPLTVTLTITNTGPNPATAVQLSNPLPPGAALLDAMSPTGTLAFEAGQVIWKPGEVGVGGAAWLTLLLRPLEVGPLTNRVSVSATETDPAPADNESVLTVDVILGADVAVFLAGPDLAVGVGQDFACQVTVTNRGPHTATAPRLRLDLPAGVRVSAVGLPEGSWTHLDDHLDSVLPDLPPGGVQTFPVALASPAAGEVALEATVAAAEHDRQPGNNQARMVAVVTSGADLEVQTWADTDDAIAGHEFTANVEVTNHGPNPARGVRVTGLLPPGVHVLGVEGAPGVWASEASGYSGTLEVLEPGATATATFGLRADAPGLVTHTALVSSSDFDPISINDSASFQVRALPEATLQVVLEPLTGPLLINQAITVTVRAFNRGSIPAPRTLLLAAFSDNTELLDAEFDGGKVTIAPPGVLCEFGEFAPGEAALLTIRVRGTRAGSLVAQITLYSPAASPADPNLGARLELEVIDTPTLTATRDGNRLVLSWPAAVSDFDVEFRDDAAAGGWQVLQNSKVVVDDRVIVNVKLSTQSRFYRLRKQATPGP